MTARFAATMAWTANSGSRCSATSWARKPRVSMATLATKRHWCSSLGTRPGSTPVSPALVLASRTAIACMTEATP